MGGKMFRWLISVERNKPFIYRCPPGSVLLTSSLLRSSVLLAESKSMHRAREGQAFRCNQAKGMKKTAFVVYVQSLVTILSYSFFPLVDMEVAESSCTVAGHGCCVCSVCRHSSSMTGVEIMRNCMMQDAPRPAMWCRSYSGCGQCSL